MNIPIGNFGNAIAAPAPAVNSSQGTGLAQFGNVGMQIGAQMLEEQRALNRTKAANDFQDYKIAVHTAGLDLAPSLADGTLSAADAGAKYKEKIAAIQKPDASYADPVTAENVSRGIIQAQAEGMNAIRPMISQAQVLEQKSTVDLGMDKIGKLAGLPGADPVKELSALDAYDADGLKSYGKNWAAKKQEFLDKTWFQVGQSRLQQNSSSMDALKAIKQDLQNTTDGTYVGKLDTNQRTALIAQTDQYIHGVVIDENNARVIAERAQKEQQDKIMQGYLVRTVAGKLTVGEVLKNDTLDFTQKLHMKSIIEAQSNKMDRTDAGIFGDLFQRIHGPADAKNAITSADQLYPYVGNGLSITDMARLRAEVDGKNQPEGELLKNFKTMAQAQISGSTMFGKDPAGEQNFYQWNAYFDQVLAQKRKSGIPMHDLLDPKSKEYLGSTIDGYKRDFNQQTADYVARFKSGTAVQKNAKGWALQTDVKGNKAYVSPDGKQFEEVK